MQRYDDFRAPPKVISIFLNREIPKKCFFILQYSRLFVYLWHKKRNEYENYSGYHLYFFDII